MKTALATYIIAQTGRRLRTLLWACPRAQVILREHPQWLGRLLPSWNGAEGARGRVFRYYALVPHAYRCTPSRGSAAAWSNFIKLRKIHSLNYCKHSHYPALTQGLFR